MKGNINLEQQESIIWLIELQITVDKAFVKQYLIDVYNFI